MLRNSAATFPLAAYADMFRPTEGDPLAAAFPCNPRIVSIRRARSGKPEAPCVRRRASLLWRP